MPERKFSAETLYRYGFNGKEQDKDMNSLTAYDYGFRIYNPAIAKFLSVDPLTKSYPELTPYQFASNTPIQSIDLDGLESQYYDVNICFGKKVLPLECADIKLVKESGFKILKAANGLPGGIAYTPPGPMGQGQLYTINYSFHIEVPNGDGIQDGVAYLYLPNSKEDRLRGGLYMYTKDGHGSGMGVGGPGESDEPAIELSVLLGAAGGAGLFKNGFDFSGQGITKLLNILESVAHIAEGGGTLSEVHEYVNEAVSKNNESKVEINPQSPTNTPSNTKPTPAQDNSTPGIEPGKRKTIKLHFDKTSAENEKGNPQKVSGRKDPSVPDTNYYQNKKKRN